LYYNSGRGHFWFGAQGERRTSEEGRAFTQDEQLQITKVLLKVNAEMLAGLTDKSYEDIIRRIGGLSRKESAVKIDTIVRMISERFGEKVRFQNKQSKQDARQAAANNHKTVLVTGCAGYIGSIQTRRLLDAVVLTVL